LQASHISKSYGIKQILHNVSLSIHDQDRWGLVGENGSGKTTLCKILLGIEKPDQGTIEKGMDVEIGYLPSSKEISSKILPK
jgi:ATPase subunit of ABC transporter with duplicated ATPase domains